MDTLLFILLNMYDILFKDIGYCFKHLISFRPQDTLMGFYFMAIHVGRD